MSVYNTITKNTDLNLDTLMEDQKYAIYKTGTSHNHLTSPVANLIPMKGSTEAFDTQMLDSSFNEIQSLRSELDVKLKELYHLDNSVYSENKMSYDTTIYTGLLWTVLGTSMLYVVFTKL